MQLLLRAAGHFFCTAAFLITLAVTCFWLFPAKTAELLVEAQSLAARFSPPSEGRHAFTATGARKPPLGASSPQPDHPDLSS